MVLFVALFAQGAGRAEGTWICRYCVCRYPKAIDFDLEESMETLQPRAWGITGFVCGSKIVDQVS